MSRTQFCGELCNHKVLPKGHLILLNSQWSGMEKLNMCWDMPPKKKVRNTITRRGFISDCKTFNLLLTPNNIWHEVLERLNKILLHQTIV